MSDRSSYCKKLIRKAMVIFNNLGENEEEEVMGYMDQLDTEAESSGMIVDDINACKCEKRSDVVAFSNKKYCCDCLCYIEEK